LNSTMFTLWNNPFIWLDVSLRDNRHQIIQAAEIASLIKSQNDCTRARAILINPKDRVHAELAWLPGISPSRATSICTNSDRDLYKEADRLNIPQLCKINLICGAIESGLLAHLPVPLLEVLNTLTALVDTFDFHLLQNQINEDRAIAEFAPIVDINDLKEAFIQRLQTVVLVITAGFESVPTDHLIEQMNRYAETWTSYGQDVQSTFAETILKSYDAQSHHFLTAEAASIEKFIEKLKSAKTRLDTSFIEAIGGLKVSVKNWNNVARPAQLLFEARGQKHSLSGTISSHLMNLAFHLNFEYMRDDLSLDIANFSLYQFSSCRSIKENIEQNIVKLEGFRDDFNAEHTISTGFIFKLPLHIKNRTLKFKEKEINVEDITRLRWSINKIGDNSYIYRVGWGNESNEVLMLTNAPNFNKIRDLLLDLAGYRLMVRKLTGELLRGCVFIFPNITIADDHVKLRKRGFFSARQYQSFGWKSISVEYKYDRIRISATKDPSFYAELKFLRYWNINLLAMLIKDNLVHADIERLSLTYS